nr:Gal-binding and CUB domains containing receptor 2 [Arenicola marina]
MVTIALTYLALASVWLFDAVTTEDVCVREQFTPVCAANEVIVMKSAAFGRMEIGRCIKTDFGHIACQSDALQLMDSICSGLPSCSFLNDMNDERLLKLNQCPMELISYLELEYECVKVDVPAHRFCHEPIQVSNQHGIIASLVTDSTRCGSPHAPLVIRGSPGQRINISLVDFGWSVSDGFDQAILDNVKCEPYGYVAERELGINKTICGGGRRQQHLHLSATSKVEITVIPKDRRKIGGAFFLQYDAIGCSDLVPPAHAWYKREGDSARIGCEWNHNSWHLTCEGNSWSGVVGNCSAPVETQPSAKEATTLRLSPVLTVGLIIGLAVLAVTLICILLIGCIYFKRRQPRRSPQAPDPTKCGTMIEQHTLVRRYQPGQGAPGMSDNPSGVPCGPPPKQPYPVRCGTGPHGMTASRAPPQPWDRSLPNQRGGPPTWGAGPQPDYSCPRPRGGQGGTLIKDKDKELDTSDSGSDYYWAGTHKYHVLDKDKPDWSQ